MLLCILVYRSEFQTKPQSIQVPLLNFSQHVSSVLEMSAMNWVNDPILCIQNIMTSQITFYPQTTNKLQEITAQ